MSGQLDLFAGDGVPVEKPLDDRVRRLRVIITVKAAPQPSATYGETVCVAGISADLERPGWIRLYPINFRYLDQESIFKKYDLVSLDALPARGDGRPESWRPRMGTLTVERHLPAWRPRRPWLDPVVLVSMCRLLREATETPPGPSLGLIRPRRILGFTCRRHPGWSTEEQGKIDAYVNQLDLFRTDDRSPLEAPRMRGAYRWLCWEEGCRGHEQSVLDWEFVVLQRRLAHLDDDALVAALSQRFLTDMCRPQNDIAFYVGNQAKRRQTFSILGVYYPRRT